jgi:hypothetical protein
MRRWGCREAEDSRGGQKGIEVDTNIDGEPLSQRGCVLRAAKSYHIQTWGMRRLLLRKGNFWAKNTADQSTGLRSQVEKTFQHSSLKTSHGSITQCHCDSKRRCSRGPHSHRGDSTDSLPAWESMLILIFVLDYQQNENIVIHRLTMEIYLLRNLSPGNFVIVQTWSVLTQTTPRLDGLATIF